ncbi:MAG: response regulator [Synechococcales cyanobacterium]
MPMNEGTFDHISPAQVLQRLGVDEVTGRWIVTNGAVTWNVYLDRGKLVYVSCSVDPFDQLDCHLRRLGYQPSAEAMEAHAQAPQVFMADWSDLQATEDPQLQAVCWLLTQDYLTPDQSAQILSAFVEPGSVVIADATYQALYWLVKYDYMTLAQVTSLLQALTQENLELLLSVTQGSYELVDHRYALFDFEPGSLLFESPTDMPRFCTLDLAETLQRCGERLEQWRALQPLMFSPYQRLYCFRTVPPAATVAIDPRLGGVLKGFSLRHLAVLLDRDELRLAQALHPIIVSGDVVIREPRAPFDRLPTFTSYSPASLKPLPTESNQERMTLVCFSENDTIKTEMLRFLDDSGFEVVVLGDPAKGLLQLMQWQPDLLLVDMGLQAMSSYEVCRLIRQNANLKAVPLILVSRNISFLDRARMSLVGVNDYITLPFTQSELLKLVYKHLTSA